MRTLFIGYRGMFMFPRGRWSCLHRYYHPRNSWTDANFAIIVARKAMIRALVKQTLEPMLPHLQAMIGTGGMFGRQTVVDRSLQSHILTAPATETGVTMPKLIAITNAEMTLQTGGRASLGCEYDGKRYHFWISNTQQRTIECVTSFAKDKRGIVEHDYGIVYCNPPLKVTRHDLGYFNTRKLKSNVGVGKQIYDALMEQWDVLYPLAAANQALEDEKELQALRKRMKKNAIEERAERMYTLLVSSGSIGDPAWDNMRRELLTEIDNVTGEPK